MKESALTRNHSTAQSVPTNSVKQLVLRLMNESTLMRNHSVAQSVTRNLVATKSVDMIIYRLLKETDEKPFSWLITT